MYKGYGFKCSKHLVTFKKKTFPYIETKAKEEILFLFIKKERIIV